MVAVNKKKLALLEKKNQEKLRNLAMKNGVTLIALQWFFLNYFKD